MRQRALDMGYTLNEHGLSVMKSGKKGEKVDIDFPTEKSIFEFLGMKYKEPKQREGYKSVELLDKKKEEPKEEDDDKVEKSPSKESSPKKVSNNKTIKVKKYKTGFKEHISDFKKNGIDTLKILTEKQLETILDETQKAYYNDP